MVTAFTSDWHRDRVVDAIREAAERWPNPEVADALAAAVKKQQTAELSETRRREREEAETARRFDRGVAVAVLSAQAAALLATDPIMTLLDAVEFVTQAPDEKAGFV